MRIDMHLFKIIKINQNFYTSMFIIVKNVQFLFDLKIKHRIMYYFGEY